MRKRGIVADYLPWLILGIAVLITIIIAIFLLKEKSISIIDKLKNIFRA